MLTVLVAIRDFLIAMALAWVGVTLNENVGADRCVGDSCQAQDQDSR
ncbi:MAG: hypothetical protein JNM59_00205 [Hyphomonadaceae bacterium]|nr:hypothetical protein [Hyphomonadaceae bacterium]